MTKEEYLQLATSKWPELEQLKAEGDFLAYEKRFAQIWVELGRSMLQSSISQVPLDRRGKKKFKRGLGGSK